MVPEPLLPEIFPEMLGGIEFRTVRRLLDEGHVVGDLQRPRPMTRSAVQDHRDLLIGMALRYFREKHGQRGRVHIRQNEGIEFPILRADGGERVGVLANDLAAGFGPLSRLAPRTSRVGDPAEPAFILEHQAEAATREDRFDFSLDDHSGGKKHGTLRERRDLPWDDGVRGRFCASRDVSEDGR